MKDNEFGSIEQAIQDIREGKMIICTDDPDRENEGDLICAAEKITPEIINFMATYGKGLICMPMGEKVIDKLGLSQMVDKNTDNHETAFTVSIDHVDTTTGISAHERAKTAVECTRDDAQPSEFRRPGHMFPLKAKAKGVFERRGHTEATVDLCRLAGLKECGICCEIMKDDGHMMRKTELLEMAKKHKLTFITIKDLIEYRKKNDIFMERVCAADFPTRYGQFKIYGYVNKINGEHHIAMVKGSVDDGKPVLVRVHSECLTGDALGSARCDCGDQYDAAMKEIAKEGRGILVYLRQEGRGIGLINKLRAYELQDAGMDTVEANIALGFDADLRDYSVGAQILKDLGAHDLDIMTNNPEKIEGLESYGIAVHSRIPIEVEYKDSCKKYMQTKKEKMGHILNKV